MPDVNAIIHWVETVFMPYNALGLFVLSFIESSFFPVPPDVLLIPLALRRPEQALDLAFITSAGSVLGGAFGYWLGKVGGRPILRHFASEGRIDSIAGLFRKYGVWAVGIAGFTPIPYKLFTLAAGVFLMNFRLFVLTSAVSRSARFFIVAWLIRHYGERIIVFLTTEFEAATLLIVLVALTGYYFFSQRQKRK